MMKKIIVTGIVFFTMMFGYAQACSRSRLSDEELRMSRDLIVVAKVINYTHIEKSTEDVWSPDPDSFFDFEIEKTFKGDEGIKTFTITQESLSSCSSGYRVGTTYLLYLNKSSQQGSGYYSPYVPATKVRDYGKNIKPEFNPLREKQRYIQYTLIKKSLFRTRRNTKFFFIDLGYTIQDKYNYYKYKYGWY